MRKPALWLLVPLLVSLAGRAVQAGELDQRYARDPAQPLDAAYTARIAAATTDPHFNSPLTDYLPASADVPTPQAVLGDIAGAPNMLPHSAEVYRYFRLLEKATPRVRVFSIGKTEEGREMIAVAVADEALLKDLDANNARLAQLADPRSIGMDDSRAGQLVAQSTPVYYITGTIHSTETGAPTALMELAYRLAVDNAPYIKAIRSHVITLITPIVEVDGRDRMADLYAWHRAHPDQIMPPLMYWGHYVAHDNNRDAMTLTLNLTRNVLETYLGWHAQVLHDLHESVPFLYDNTVGDGPYNAWIDPILAGEWQQLGWDNVQQMTQLGMPGVFTHGDFDTWSPGYLMFIAAMHNGISRLYETFGNGGADTVERDLDPADYSRTWYRQNPPYPKVLWSQRDNNNYEQTALLTTLSTFAANGKTYLHNYYEKSRRSILKPGDAGPAAYVLPADDPHPHAQYQLLSLLAAQHAEISRASADFTVQVPALAAPDDSTAAPMTGKSADNAGDDGADHHAPKATTEARSFPAGSWLIRMDQPYSRIADALLDRQYWAPDDPQKHPYDDTGWSMGDLFDTEVVRVEDPAALQVPVSRTAPVAPAGGASGSGAWTVIDDADSAALLGLRLRLPRLHFAVATAPLDTPSQSFDTGVIAVQAPPGDAALAAALKQFGLQGIGADLPANAPLRSLPAAPRIALMHTWLDTQTEGWWRMALDKLGVPYQYISTQTAAHDPALRKRFDAILFGPVGVGSQQIIDGLPMWGAPMPWQKTALTPNLGLIDSTDDMRPGLGEQGLANLKAFVRDGGLLITASDTARFAIDEGLAPGVSVAETKDLKVVGSVLLAQRVDHSGIVARGYDDEVALYSPDGLSFSLSNLSAGGQHLPNAGDNHRPTGRGGPNDADIPQGRPRVDTPDLPDPKPWQAQPLNAEQARNNPFLIPPGQRPFTVLHWAGADDLLISGLLDGQGPADHAAVVVAPYGHGNVLLFANNPIWRGETIGSYSLVFNALLDWDGVRAH